MKHWALQEVVEEEEEEQKAEDVEEVKAEMHNGILSINIPKETPSPKETPTKLNIE